MLISILCCKDKNEMKYIIITIILTIIIYTELVSFFKRIEIYNIEKKTKKLIDMLITIEENNPRKKLVLSFYNSYKQINFKNRLKGLQLEIIKLLFTYIRWNIEVICNNHIYDEDINNIKTRQNNSCITIEQSEIILKNILIYAKNLNSK